MARTVAEHPSGTRNTDFNSLAEHELVGGLFHSTC